MPKSETTASRSKGRITALGIFTVLFCLFLAGTLRLLLGPMAPPEGTQQEEMAAGPAAAHNEEDDPESGVGSQSETFSEPKEESSEAAEEFGHKLKAAALPVLSSPGVICENLASCLITFIAEMKNAPYPYNGKYDDTSKDFFDYTDAKTRRRYHTNRYNTRYPEEPHYTDSSVLFHVPPAFRPEEPFSIVLYFHGHLSELVPKLTEHEIMRQVNESGRNLILIAPQLAKNAIDSSPGKFYNKGGFKRFMEEAEQILYAQVSLLSQISLTSSPSIILVAHSGGYKAVAYILDRGGLSDQIIGIILFDALYEELPKFQQWLAHHGRRAFFVSLYTSSTERNNHNLMMYLKGLHIKYREDMPEALRRGDIHFIRTLSDHHSIPLSGPPRHPLTFFLRRSLLE